MFLSLSKCFCNYRMTPSLCSHRMYRQFSSWWSNVELVVTWRHFHLLLVCLIYSETQIYEQDETMDAPFLTYYVKRITRRSPEALTLSQAPSCEVKHLWISLWLKISKQSLVLSVGHHQEEFITSFTCIGMCAAVLVTLWALLCDLSSTKCWKNF